MDKKKSCNFSGLLAFIIGIPSALSFGILKRFTIFNLNFFDIISFFSVNILVPLGGLLASILIAWVLSMKKAFDNLKVSKEDFFHSSSMDCFLFKNMH